MAELKENNRYELNKELAQMLKGGVIMDVTTPEQARVAEAAGACAVMALERIPADIRAAGGVARMSDPAMIKSIQQVVSIPVMANAVSGILWKLSSCRPSRLTTSMKAKSFPRQMMSTISTSATLPCPLSAVPGIWARPCGASMKALP